MKIYSGNLLSILRPFTRAKILKIKNTIIPLFHPIQFQKQFQNDAKTIIPNHQHRPFSHFSLPPRPTNQNPGRDACQSRALNYTCTVLFSFFLPHPTPPLHAKGCRNAAVSAAYLPLNRESCECKSNSLPPPFARHVVVVNWHDFAVLPHLAPWLSGSSINKCMSALPSCTPSPPPHPTTYSIYVRCVRNSDCCAHRQLHPYVRCANNRTADAPVCPGGGEERGGWLSDETAAINPREISWRSAPLISLVWKKTVAVESEVVEEGGRDEISFFLLVVV